MKLDVRAMMLALAVGWGFLAMFVTGMANLIWPSYGVAFLEVMASIYPGYEAGASLGQVLVGTFVGVLDGALAGLVFATLYNRFSR